MNTKTSVLYADSATTKNSYLVSRQFDTIWILGPQLAGLVLGLLLLSLGLTQTGPWTFLLAIVFVDVAHVYATLFRTYLHPSALKKNLHLLLGVPLTLFLVASIIHGISPFGFWRTMAYLAIFHFIRQQYGLICLYQKDSTARRLDGFFIQAFPILAVLHWHLSGQKQFSWFISGDLLYIQGQQLLPILEWSSLLLMSSYLVYRILAQEKKPCHPTSHLLFFCSQHRFKLVGWNRLL